jgi:hypothetical protein
MVLFPVSFKASPTFQSPARHSFTMWLAKFLGEKLERWTWSWGSACKWKARIAHKKVVCVHRMNPFLFYVSQDTINYSLFPSPTPVSFLIYTWKGMRKHLCPGVQKAPHPLSQNHEQWNCSPMNSRLLAVKGGIHISLVVVLVNNREEAIMEGLLCLVGSAAVFSGVNFTRGLEPTSTSLSCHLVPTPMRTHQCEWLSSLASTSLSQLHTSSVVKSHPTSGSFFVVHWLPEIHTLFRDVSPQFLSVIHTLN